MLVIGQSLECWRPPLADAVAERDAAPLIERARQQVDAGATALDVNFGATGREGLDDDLRWAAQALRAAFAGTQLFLDCGDLDALGAAVEVTSTPVVVNAIPLEGERVATAGRLLEAAARAGAGIVFSPRAADRSEDGRAILPAAQSARAEAARAGIRGPVYLDCLTYPPTSDLDRCRRSLRWVAALRESGPPQMVPLVAAGNLGHGTSRGRRRWLRMVYVSLAAASGVGAVMLPVEDRALVSLASVLNDRAAPRTAFEAWAVALRASGTSEPPPGSGARTAWELLVP